MTQTSQSWVFIPEKQQLMFTQNTVDKYLW